ncbi:MAG TPA: hypothetical protein VE008_03940 [Burkholderiales bacterium]|nr:hypothetical protein [Burkholderiales bacterium]
MIRSLPVLLAALAAASPASAVTTETYGAGDNAYVTGNTPSAAAYPTVVQVVQSSSTKGDSVSNNGFIFVNLPQSAKPGNTIAVFFEHASSVAGNISHYAATDDTANVYTDVQGGVDSENDQATGGFYFINLPSAVKQVKLQNKSGGTLNFWQVTIVELNDVVAIDATNNGQATGTAVTGGSLSVTQTGDMILLYGARTSSVATTLFTPTSQSNIDWQLRGTDINDGTFLQAGVYNSASEINPQLDMATSTSWASVAMAFKAGASGAPKDSGNVVVNGVLHFGFLDATFSDPIRLQVPATGNLLVVVRSGGVPPGVGLMGSIQDTNGNGWFVGGSTLNDASIQRAYAISPRVGNDLVLTIPQLGGASGDHTYMVYDVSAPAGMTFELDSDFVATGTQAADTDLTTLTITPNVSGMGIVFGAVSWAHGTGIGVTDSTLVFDSMWYDGEPVDGPTNLDENNGNCHGFDLAPRTTTYQKTVASPAASGWESLGIAFRVAQPGAAGGPAP